MEIEITAMTFGPYGVGHREGKTVLMPGVAPGDVVEASIGTEHSDYTVARVERVIRASGSRRDAAVPLCPAMRRV